MHSRQRAALLIIAFALLAPTQARAQTFDLVIRNARVVDGMGNPWYRADVGIRGDRIAEIGALGSRPATRTIDARGRVLAPGFIDMMAGTSEPLVTDPVTGESKLRQGITTMMVGEGDSEAPQDERTIGSGMTIDGQKVTWRTFDEYFRILERKGIPLNVVHNVGAAQIRRIVIGEEDKRPTPAQLEQMKAMVEQAMVDGSVGFSTALIYPPGTYAKTDELIELGKVVAKYGGTYFSHMRNESNQVLDAIRETMRIGQGAGIPVHIYHLKAAGQENWPLMARAIALIDSARRAGLEVTADVYPYIRNGIGLGSFLHPRHYAEGTEKFVATLGDPAVRRRLRAEVETTSNWENWYRHVGKNWDNVLITEVGPKTDSSFVGLSIDTDASPVNPQTAPSAHPRAFGTFPRILAKYVREEHVIPLEDAVRKMTSSPANVLGLFDRGRIAPGMAADLVLFDPATVQDRATFTKPLVYATGIDVVIVNGQVAIDEGKASAASAGKVLRHGR